MKLNSDNPDTMPITDAVYGNRPFRAGKPNEPRGHTEQVFRRIPHSTLRVLARRYPKINHMAKRAG